MQVRITLPKAGTLDGKRLMNALRRASPALALLLVQRIRERTPSPRTFSKGYSTGALSESATVKPYTDDVSGSREVSLVKAYFEDGPQLDEWGRVYAPYQESEPLGLPTYTDWHAQMLYRIEQDDHDTIQQWANEAVQSELDRGFEMEEVVSGE